MHLEICSASPGLTGAAAEINFTTYNKTAQSGQKTLRQISQVFKKAFNVRSRLLVTRMPDQAQN
jgi:hypothetical protein